MIKLNRLILIAALGLALAACGNEQKARGGTADGEILPGSASDAMMPLDSVRSQAPLAPRSVSSDGPKDAAKSDSNDAEPAASGKPDEADQAPAAEPTPEAPAE